MNKTSKIEIINSPDSLHPFLVLNKPAGLPSAPLHDGDESALTFALENFPQIKEISGKRSVEHGLVHRIDTETSGLVLVALSQEFYDFMQNEQNENRFEKWYRADVKSSLNLYEKIDGFPFPPLSKSEIQKKIAGNETISVESSFRKFGIGGKEVRPVSENSGKAARKKSGGTVYKTEIAFLSEEKAVAHITKGFRHQVRCHLAWLGFPVVGDKIYNPLSSGKRESWGKEKMRFEAFKIKFMNPETGSPEVFEI